MFSPPCWRQPWEELTSEFLRIYTSRKDWAIAPGALFRAAASQEALSDCSHVADEYRQARDLYLKLAQEFPKSALADDSLLRAAFIDADRLKLMKRTALLMNFARGEHETTIQTWNDEYQRLVVRTVGPGEWSLVEIEDLEMDFRDTEGNLIGLHSMQ